VNPGEGGRGGSGGVSGRFDGGGRGLQRLSWRQRPSAGGADTRPSRRPALLSAPAHVTGAPLPPDQETSWLVCPHPCGRRGVIVARLGRVGVLTRDRRALIPSWIGPVAFEWTLV